MTHYGGPQSSFRSRDSNRHALILHKAPPDANNRELVSKAVLKGAVHSSSKACATATAWV